MRRAARRDANEPDIVRAIRKLPGFYISDPLPPGYFGDRLVRKMSWPEAVCVVVEFKNPERVHQPSAYKPHQREMLHLGLTVVATSAQEVIEFCDGLRIEARGATRHGHERAD